MDITDLTQNTNLSYFPPNEKTPTPKTLPLVLYTSLTSTYPLSTTFPK